MKNTVLASAYLALVYVPFLILVILLMTNKDSEATVSSLSIWFGFSFLLTTPLLIIQTYRDGLKHK